jgi:hypothetical protein
MHAYKRCTPTRDARLWDGLCEMHAYDMAAYEMAAYGMAAYGMAPVRSMPERRAYERHTYEMVYRICTPIKCPSIREVCLRDTFNQSIQIAFTIWDPQMASLLVVINENVTTACHAFYNGRL